MHILVLTCGTISKIDCWVYVGTKLTRCHRAERKTWSCPRITFTKCPRRTSNDSRRYFSNLTWTAMAGSTSTICPGFCTRPAFTNATQRLEYQFVFFPRPNLKTVIGISSRCKIVGPFFLSPFFIRIFESWFDYCQHFCDVFVFWQLNWISFFINAILDCFLLVFFVFHLNCKVELCIVYIIEMLLYFDNWWNFIF